MKVKGPPYGAQLGKRISPVQWRTEEFVYNIAAPFALWLLISANSRPTRALITCEAFVDDEDDVVVDEVAVERDWRVVVLDVEGLPSTPGRMAWYATRAETRIRAATEIARSP